MGLDLFPIKGAMPRPAEWRNLLFKQEKRGVMVPQEKKQTSWLAIEANIRPCKRGTGLELFEK